MNEKQSLTVRLNRETIRKAKALAAERGISVSRLLSRSIEQVIGEEEAYEAARRYALAILERGFHLGGTIRATRDELHER